MSQPSREDVVELPDELDDETAEQLHTDAAEGQDTAGEVCLSSTAAGDDAGTKVWSSGDDFYRLSVR